MCIRCSAVSALLKTHIKDKERREMHRRGLRGEIKTKVHNRAIIALTYCYFNLSHHYSPGIQVLVDQYKNSLLCCLCLLMQYCYKSEQRRIGEWVAGKVSEKQRRGSTGPRYSKKNPLHVSFSSVQSWVCVWFSDSSPVCKIPPEIVTVCEDT